VLLLIASIGRSVSKFKEITDRADKGNLSTPADIDCMMKLVSGLGRSTDCRQIYKAAIK